MLRRNEQLSTLEMLHLLDKLNERQMELCELSAEGYTNPLIAKKMGLSTGHVRNMIAKILNITDTESMKHVNYYMGRTWYDRVYREYTSKYLAERGEK